MDINNIFEKCINTINNLNEKQSNLLDKLINITSPLDFTDDLGSDEEIEDLITNMVRIDMIFPSITRFSNILTSILPTKANLDIFI